MPNDNITPDAPDASKREQTRTTNEGDASGDAQPVQPQEIDTNPSLNSSHVQPRLDALGRARPRTVTQPPPENWIIINQAIARFAAAGLPIKLRTLQKYCLNKKVRSALAVTDKNTVTYFVDPTSIEEFIAREGQKTPVQTIEVEAPIVTRAPDASGRAHMRDDYDVYDHPYVKRLERDVDDFKQKYDTLQASARADLIKLHETYAVAQSETLAKYLLLEKGKSTSTPLDNSKQEPESQGV